jgi:uncharacterized membrane protein
MTEDAIQWLVIGALGMMLLILLSIVAYLLHERAHDQREAQRWARLDAATERARQSQEPH